MAELICIKQSLQLKEALVWLAFEMLWDSQPLLCKYADEFAKSH